MTHITPPPTAACATKPTPLLEQTLDGPRYWIDKAKETGRTLDAIASRVFGRDCDPPSPEAVVCSYPFSDAFSQLSAELGDLMRSNEAKAREINDRL